MTLMNSRGKGTSVPSRRYLSIATLQKQYKPETMVSPASKGGPCQSQASASTVSMPAFTPFSAASAPRDWFSAYTN
jgi:hypothetical protein